jgi:endogenous inhibitor of DNA gyrase (YacG/DUF329 family)
MDDYTRQCPECGEQDIRYGAFIEDGSIGDWCPNCNKSLQKMESDRKTPRLHMLLSIFTSWLAGNIDAISSAKARSIMMKKNPI